MSEKISLDSSDLGVDVKCLVSQARARCGYDGSGILGCLELVFQLRVSDHSRYH